MSDITSETLKRPVRTAVQGGVSYAVVEFIDAFHLYDMDERQYTVAVLVLTIVLSWLQVVGENFFNKAFLRDIPDESSA